MRTILDVIGDQSSYEQEGVLGVPIHMDTVACYGSEDKLTDCTYHTDTSEDVHNEDIWINCNTISSVTSPSQQPTSSTNNEQSNPTQHVPTSVTNNNQSNPTQQPTSVTNNQSNPTQQPTLETNNGQSIDDIETTSKNSKADTPSNTIALVVSLVGLAISLVVIGLLISRMVYKNKRKSGSTNHRWVSMGYKLLTCNYALYTMFTFSLMHMCTGFIISLMVMEILVLPRLTIDMKNQCLNQKTPLSTSHSVPVLCKAAMRCVLSIQGKEDQATRISHQILTSKVMMPAHEELKLGLSTF